MKKCTYVSECGTLYHMDILQPFLVSVAQYCPPEWKISAKKRKKISLKSLTEVFKFIWL